MTEPSSKGAQKEADAPVAAYVGAFVVYVVLGYLFKSLLLNWIVGPLFLLIVLYLLPRAVRLGRRTET